MFLTIPSIDYLEQKCKELMIAIPGSSALITADGSDYLDSLPSYDSDQLTISLVVKEKIPDISKVVEQVGLYLDQSRAFHYNRWDPSYESFRHVKNRSIHFDHILVYRIGPFINPIRSSGRWETTRVDAECGPYHSIKTPMDSKLDQSFGFVTRAWKFCHVCHGTDEPNRRVLFFGPAKSGSYIAPTICKHCMKKSFEEILKLGETITE